MAIRHLSALVALCVAALSLAACQESQIPKDIRPVPQALVSAMDRLQMRETSPVMIRLFKEESKLEVWKQRTDGQFALLKTYSICKWSGALGPKIKEGDRQAPEGFYVVTPAQMNPKSSYYLSFNIGYPNAFDRSLGRTGSNLMVHGACSSSGCYSMTDADSGELFALARDAFRGGQREFLIQAFPFRMTPENMAKHRDDPNMPFWRMLKVGYDHFEVTHQVPKIDVCNKGYVFDADSGGKPFIPSAACPAYKVPEPIASAVAAKQAADALKFTAAVARLESKAEKDAAAKQKADEKAALEAQKEAERAAKPSLLDRMLGAKATPAKPTVVAEGDVPPLPRQPPRESGAKAAAPAVAAGASPAISGPPAPRLKPAAAADQVASVEPAKTKIAKKPAVAKAPANQPQMKLLPTLDVETATAKPGAAAKAKPPLPDVIEAPPAVAAAAPVSPVPPPAAAAAAPAAPADSADKTAALGAAKPVGTFVKKKFQWPDEDAPAATPDSSTN